MTPSNPSNSQPLIYRIMDALGVSHLVACINHTHDQSEVDGLTSALAGKANAVPAGSPTGGIVIAGTSGELSRSNKTVQDLLDAINGKQDALTFDNTPTANSTNPVTSGGVKAAIEEATNVIISDNPLDMSTFEKKRVYTAILTNTTGDAIEAGEYLDVSSLPSAEKNIIFNSGMIDVPDGEEFGIRFIRTDQGVYACFDGIFAY